MAAGPITQISDIITPEIFTPYVQQLTATKNNIIASGMVARNPMLDAMLLGGGASFNVPSFKDLDSDADRVSGDGADAEFGGTASPNPFKIGTSQEIATRLSRNASWNSADLAAAVAGADPLDAIANRVANYWAQRLQVATVATLKGVFADNTANDSGDYTNDVSGTFVDGVTNFTAEAFIDATATMGDSMGDLMTVIVHSTVYARMKKNNLIDFVKDSEGSKDIPTFLGHTVVVDDGITNAANVYDTWICGPGAIQLGMGSPKVGTEVHRLPGGGNGGGQEVLYNRVEWIIHPVGHAFVGTIPDGGPANTGTGGADLDEAASWNRVYAARKQIKVARLVTTEA